MDKSKIIKCYLRKGTINGVKEITSNSWTGSIIISTKNDAKSILSEISEKRGIYFLASENEIIIGLSFELFTPIREQLLNQSWWDRLYFVNIVDNSFTNDDLKLLRDIYMKKSSELKTYRRDLTNYDFYKYKKYYKNIEDFLLESFFMFKLLDINYFSDNFPQKSHKETGKAKNKTKEIEIIKEPKAKNGHQLRKEAISIIESHGYKLSKNKNFAKISYSSDHYWINPRVEYLDEVWDLMLYNQREKKMYLLRIPAKTFTYTSKKPIGKQLLQRVDESKSNVLDMLIDIYTFVDLRSGCSFKEYIFDTFDCEIELEK